MKQERETLLWRGDNPRQGLLVLTRGKFRLASVRRKPIRAKHFLPVHIDGPVKFNLLSAWVKPSECRPIYVTTLFRGIAAYRDFIKSSPTVFLGDLNTERFLSAGDSHMEFVDTLRSEFGLVSAYHEYFGEEHGHESQHTYFDRTKRGKPFHIDYCFIPTSWLPKLEVVTVGTRREFGGLSDHMPLTVEIRI